MPIVAAIFLICCIAALVWYYYSSTESESDVPVSLIRQQAYDLVRADSRLAQVIMLLSYSDMDNPTVEGVRRRSNRRLVLEVRQIARRHFPDLTSEEVNTIAAQLLIIARNIGRKRRQNANMPVSKCE